MPFDAAELKPIDKLINALRGPEPAWWDFNRCSKCAMHVAVTLGMAEGERCYLVAEGLGIPLDVAYDIFSPKEIMRASPGRVRAVRPRHVAAALEHYRDHHHEPGYVAKSPFEFVGKEGGA